MISSWTRLSKKTSTLERTLESHSVPRKFPLGAHCIRSQVYGLHVRTRKGGRVGRNWHGECHIERRGFCFSWLCYLRPGPVWSQGSSDPGKTWTLDNEGEGISVLKKATSGRVNPRASARPASSLTPDTMLMMVVLVRSGGLLLYEQAVFNILD